MEQFQTGAVRDTGGKGRMDLLPMCALIRISKHMEDAIKPDPETGVPHYPERNWEKGIPIHSMIDSALRHIAKYVDGMTDEDHLCAAATNLLMAMWMEEKKPEMQDIPTRIPHDEFPLSPYAQRATSLAREQRRNTEVPPKHSMQEKAKEEPKKKIMTSCRYLEMYRTPPACSGTKEHDPCKYMEDLTECPGFKPCVEYDGNGGVVYAHIL